MNLDDEVLVSYLAALIDGEGTIGVYKVRGPRSLRDSFYVQVTVTGTSVELMEWLVCTFGSTADLRRDPGRSRSHRQPYGWRVHGLNAGSLLEAVQPFLVIKRRQCEVAMRLRAVQRHDGRPLSDADVAAREAIYVEMRELNRRGQPQDHVPPRITSATARAVLTGREVVLPRVNSQDVASLPPLRIAGHECGLANALAGAVACLESTMSIEGSFAVISNAGIRWEVASSALGVGPKTMRDWRAGASDIGAHRSRLIRFAAILGACSEILGWRSLLFDFTMVSVADWRRYLGFGGEPDVVSLLDRIQRRTDVSI